MRHIREQSIESGQSGLAARPDLRFDTRVDTLDRLLASPRRCCLSLPDQRSGTNTQYAMADFGLAAFSVFFMRSPSFLEHQRHLAKERGRSNCETLFGMNQNPRRQPDPREAGSDRTQPVSPDV